MLPQRVANILVIFKRAFAQAAVVVKVKPSRPKQEPLTRQKRLNRFLKNHARVAVLGADTTTGKALAFLLKQNPLVSQIFLYGKGIKGTVLDLKHFDTRCRVKGYEGHLHMPEAVRCADIIALMGSDHYPRTVNAEVRMKYEAERVARYARVCSLFAPRSIILVCAHPVSYTLPLITAVYKKTNWYHPGRIIGSTDLTQIRVNSLAARYQDLDPVSVHVPIIGGPESHTVVPLFSRAQPCDFPMEDAEILQTRIRKVAKEKTVKSIEKCPLLESSFSEAYGINRSITSVALGLCGDNHAAGACFLRQNIINTCKYLVTTVKFGRNGVEHNYGIPKLTRTELKHFEKTLLSLRKSEKKVLKIVENLKVSPKAKEETQLQLSPYSSEPNPICS